MESLWRSGETSYHGRRVYSDNVLKFYLGNVMAYQCKSDSGVRQECPLSSLLFNLYVRVEGMKI